jgi:hypothetical protein
VSADEPSPLVPRHSQRLTGCPSGFLRISSDLNSRPLAQMLQMLDQKVPRFALRLPSSTLQSRASTSTTAHRLPWRAFHRHVDLRLRGELNSCTRLSSCRLTLPPRRRALARLPVCHTIVWLLPLPNAFVRVHPRPFWLPRNRAMSASSCRASHRQFSDGRRLIQIRNH